MLVGEMMWNGQYENVSYWLDKHTPAPYDFTEVMRAGRVKLRGERVPVGYKASTFKSVGKEIKLFGAWKVSMETNIMADEAANRAAEAVKNLDAVTTAFRANTKNDIASMKAASERVQNEVLRMKDQYIAAQQILTSPDFLMAVANAERLAAALESIHKLQGQRVGFAVFSGSEGK